MKVQIELPALKADDYDVDSFAAKNVKILEVALKQTEFGERKHMVFRGEQDARVSLYLNKPSMNALIKAFGTETDDWVGHAVNVRCTLSKGKSKKKMLLVEPIKPE